MKKQPKVEAGSGNVFEDLGYSNAADALFKARLAQRIATVIQARKLSQAQAAQILHADQPKISKLLRGQLREFSTDRLIHFLLALGQDVEVKIRNRRSTRRRGALLVLSE